jgi:hypothetical protein
MLGSSWGPSPRTRGTPLWRARARRARRARVLGSELGATVGVHDPRRRARVCPSVRVCTPKTGKNVPNTQKTSKARIEKTCSLYFCIVAGLIKTLFKKMLAGRREGNLIPKPACVRACSAQAVHVYDAASGVWA